MNFEQARFNMVEQQVRTWEVLDQRVLDAVSSLPRECFVPAEYRRLAYADTPLPLPDGQQMMTPGVEARMLQALASRPGERVLEVGTGSGYITALLTVLGAHVTSVELSPRLHQMARENLAAEGIANVTLVHGDALMGWPQGAPWDAIAVTGSVPVPGSHFQQQLAVGGRLFIVVGEEPAMQALLVTRTGEQEYAREYLFETVVPPLIGARPRPTFVL